MLIQRVMVTCFGLPAVGINEILPDPTLHVDDPILDGICIPPFFGPTSHDDYAPLLRIARTLDPAVVVELGTAFGNLTANICRQCPSAKVYTVNAPSESQTGNVVTFTLAREEIGRVYRKLGYADRVVQIYQNTLDLDLSEYFQRPIVDLAIIDACHDQEFVTNDFHKVRPYVRPGGIILFHDTHPSLQGHLAGSYAACMRLRQCRYDVRHIRGTWWAIWVNMTQRRWQIAPQMRGHLSHRTTYARADNLFVP